MTMVTTDVRTRSEEAQVLDRETAKAQALYGRLADTELKIKASKERNLKLTEDLAQALLVADGQSTPQVERLRRELSKLADEAADLTRLELGLRKALSAQGERVDAAREVVDRLLAEAAAAEWLELFQRLTTFCGSEGARALREAIVRTFRTFNDGAPRSQALWLPSSGELERMRALIQQNFDRLRKDGYEV